MITVIYNLFNGTCKHQDFTNTDKAFDKFYSMVNNARRDPFISSPDHIGFFSHRDIEWYMTKDQEGKELALIRFNHWLKNFHKDNSNRVFDNVVRGVNL